MPADFIYGPLLNADSTAWSNGMLLRISGTRRGVRAQADSAAHLQGLVGVNVSGIVGIGGQANVAVSGALQPVLCVSGLTIAPGDTLYVSTTAGLATNVSPAIPVAVGTVEDTSSYSRDSRVLATINIPSSTVSGGGVFPGFGTPVSIGPNEPVAGVALTAMRSDAQPGQKIQAAWPLANFRWYALDGTNGDDNNAGFSDTSSADAGTKAKKTVAGLAAIVPRIGANRKIAIIYAAGTYADSIDTFLQGLGGYSVNSFAVGTVTNATAGSVAFAGDANDRIMAGFVVPAGLSATGYDPTGSPSTTTMTCQIHGGGAPGFAAEPANLGYRIRFDSGVATQAALRNVCRTIVGVPTSGSLNYQTLPAVPLGTDVFYIEKPGLVMSAGRSVFVAMAAMPPQFASGVQGGFQLVGFDLTDTMRFGFVNLRLAGCRLGGATIVDRPEAFDYEPTYIDETGTTRTIGATLRCESSFQLNDYAQMNPLGQQSGCFVGQVFLNRSGSANLGASSYLGGGFIIDEAWQALQAFAVHAPFNAIGNINSGTFPGAFRIKGVISNNAGARSAIQVCASDTSLVPMTIDGIGAFPCVQLVGTCQVSINSGVAGVTGNTDVGLDLTLSKGSLIFLPNGAPTVTGTAGDVRLGGGQIVTWAQLAATGLVDSNGNRIISSGQPALARLKFSGGIVTSAGGATLSYLSDAGTRLATANQVNPQRYPTSLMIMLRLRVTKLVGAGVVTNNITCTLYQNGAPTAMQVTILAADVQFTKYVDSAHPILFADGDDFDLRLDDAGADVLAGTLLASGELEYAAA